MALGRRLTGILSKEMRNAFLEPRKVEVVVGRPPGLARLDVNSEGPGNGAATPSFGSFAESCLDAGENPRFLQEI